jgi:hypothetical protein
MNNWRSGGDEKIPAEFFKALCKGYGSEDATETTNACVAALVSMYQQYWMTGSYPGEEDIKDPRKILAGEPKPLDPSINRRSLFTTGLPISNYCVSQAQPLPFCPSLRCVPQR